MNPSDLTNGEILLIRRGLKGLHKDSLAEFRKADNGFDKGYWERRIGAIEALEEKLRQLVRPYLEAASERR